MELNTLIKLRDRLEAEYAGKRSILDKIIETWRNESAPVTEELAEPKQAAPTKLKPIAHVQVPPPTPPRDRKSKPSNGASRPMFDPASQRGQIVSLIQAQPDEWSLDHVRAAFPKTPSGSISSAVHALKSIGWIESTRPSWYRNTDKMPPAGKPMNRVEAGYREFRSSIAQPTTDTE